MTIPTHEYETTEGTEPGATVTHEPRTIKHTVTDSSPESEAQQVKALYMMSEIGDGVFVQWGSCSHCNKPVKTCKCVGGPVEPEHISKWRPKRFERSLNTRPDPDHTFLPTLLTWIRERGYTVTKKSEAKTTKIQPEQFVEPTRGPTQEEFDEAKSQQELQREIEADIAEVHAEDVAAMDGEPFDVPEADRVAVFNEAVEAAEQGNSEVINAGLEETLEKVRAAKRDTSDIDPGF